MESIEKLYSSRDNFRRLMYENITRRYWNNVWNTHGWGRLREHVWWNVDGLVGEALTKGINEIINR